MLRFDLCQFVAMKEYLTTLLALLLLSACGGKSTSSNVKSPGDEKSAKDITLSEEEKKLWHSLPEAAEHELMEKLVSNLWRNNSYLAH